MSLTNFLTTDKALASVLNDKVVTPANAHINSTTNPHGVTKAQVGLINVTDDAQIPKSIIDAAGDLIYGAADNTPARLAKGTARQQLAMNAGATAPEWVASLQSLITAAGDIVYGSAANTPAKLAKGTDGQVLTLASGMPSWATPVKLVTGTYVGNDSTIARKITIGFTPKIVIVGAGGFTSHFSITQNSNFGAATQVDTTVSAQNSASTYMAEIISDGFNVIGDSSYGLNDSGVTYYYTVIG